MTIIYFIIALSILVLVHEWGHYMMARRAGIRVEQFSIGFGPKLFSVTRGETEFKISLLPLGGFVKLFGEDPEAEAEGDAKKAEEIAASPDAFSAKPVWARLLTVLAGPLMNLFLCFVLMPLVFMVGRMVPRFLEEPPVVIGVKGQSPAEKVGIQIGDHILKIDESAVETWTDVLQWIILHPDTQVALTIDRAGQIIQVPIHTTLSPLVKETMGYTGFEPHFFVGDEPVVGSVTPGNPADKAGLQEKDVIRKINNQEVNSWIEMTSIISESQGGSLSLEYQRGDQLLATSIQPVYNEALKKRIIGITQYRDPHFYVNKRYGPVEAVVQGTKENLKLLGLTGEVLSRLFTFKLSYKALGGPIQIAQASGAAARSGLGEFFYFLCFLSMQLGILNLLPIPILDGGHVLFMVIEGVRGKALSIKVRHSASMVGLVLLLTLMLVVTINDVDRVWGFTRIVGWIKGVF